MMKLYAERDTMQLDRDGNYYCRHVSAMTAEGLHSKSDIAAELAWRDRQIDELRAFKQYVHDRLDGMGIPVDPDSPHKAAGCRIGGRLDYVEQTLSARSVQGEAKPVAWGAWNKGKTRLVRFDGVPDVRYEPSQIHNVPLYTTPQPAVVSVDWRGHFVAQTEARYRDAGMKIEQAMINAETDAWMLEVHAIAAAPTAAEVKGA
ncbi:MAG: hypothetical protein JSR70_08540 [Proteobacteria bacterium]|nr:hypothetical protein [Pseudomonadota bacterium]